MNKFLTGDTIDPSVACFVLTGQSADWFKWALSGALWNMTNPHNWVQNGDITPEQAASLSIELWSSIEVLVNPFPIGRIEDFATPEAPAGWLWCDGSHYLETDYPELYEAIGNFWDTDPISGSFQVPDTRGQTRINVGQRETGETEYTLGQKVGVETVELTAAQNGTHSHVDSGHEHAYSPPGAAVLVVAPGEAPVTAVNIFPGTTSTGFANLQSSGGSDPHENRQPSQAFITCIYAGRE